MEESKVRWFRSPVDAANVVVGFVALAAIIAIAILLRQATQGMSEDLVELFERIPDTLDQFLIGFIQLALLGVGAGLLIRLIWRRMWGCIGVLLLAGTIGGLIGALAFNAIDDVVPRETILATKANSFVVGSAFPSPMLVSAVAAVVTAGAPWLNRRQRRVTWVALIGLAVLRVLTTTTVPTTVAGMIAGGFIAGSLTLLATGSPQRRPRLSHIKEALAAAGFPVESLEWAEPDARLLQTLVAQREDASALYVKVVDDDTREADVVFRFLNSMRVRGLEDEHPNRSAAQTVEREALGAMLAADSGVATPHVRAVTETSEGGTVLVADFLPGRRLSDLEAWEIDDDLLDGVWRQVDLLAQSRIAHRTLDTRHVLVTPDDEVALLNFRSSILSAGDSAVRADSAEMLASMAVLVGSERAVASAARVLDAEDLRQTLPLLQPLALTMRTRRSIGSGSDLLDELRDGVQAATQSEEVELAELRRVTVWGVLTWIGVAVLASFVLAVATNLEDIFDALSEANWAWIALVVLAVALTYVAGAVLLVGTATVRLALPLTSWVMLAQSFLNRFTPANAGGMAMRVRYLQKSGEGLGTAASTVGITTVVGSVMHWVILVVFLLWAGSADQTSFELPDVNIAAIVLVAVGVAAGVLFFTSWGRKTVLPWIAEAWDTVGGQVLMILKSPARLTAVLGGAAASKVLMLFAFFFTLMAFDIDMTFVRACSLYLIATTIGGAVPTPGGVGGVEAALTAALTGAGIDSGLAFSVVLIFRLVSYWLPVPFGWIALHDVQKRDVV